MCIALTVDSKATEAAKEIKVELYILQAHLKTVDVVILVISETG